MVLGLGVGVAIPVVDQRACGAPWATTGGSCAPPPCARSPCTGASAADDRRCRRRRSQRPASSECARAARSPPPRWSWARRRPGPSPRSRCRSDAAPSARRWRWCRRRPRSASGRPARTLLAMLVRKLLLACEVRAPAPWRTCASSPADCCCPARPAAPGLSVTCRRKRASLLDDRRLRIHEHDPEAILDHVERDLAAAHRPLDEAHSS